MSIRQSDQIIKTEKTPFSRSIFPQKQAGRKYNRLLILRKEGFSSIYLKILLNYFHSISIIDNFNLKWPLNAKNYLNIFDFAGNLSSNTFSFECVLIDYNIQMRIPYFKTLFFSLLPIFMNVISSFILFLLYMRSGKSQRNRFVVILIVSSIFFQPTMIKILFENMTYINLEGENLLKSYLKQNFDDNSHQFWF